MSGRGVLAEAAPSSLLPDPRIMVFGNDDTLRIAQEPIDDAAGQIDAVSADKAAGVGPALSFAKALIAERPHQAILLVPCAKGGSPVAAWAPSRARGTLYGSCLARAKTAAQQGELAAILWYQGESDTATPELASAWPPAFKSLVENLRTDLSSPGLPVIMVAIGDPPTEGPYASRFPAWLTVQAAQEAFTASGILVVPAAGLPRNDDELHLSTAGQIELGRRLARVWLEQPAPD